MKVSELGEFGLIDRLTELVTARRPGPASPDAQGPGGDGPRLLVDVGDDTAAWLPGTGTELNTTDTAVEGVHFTRETTPWYDLGWKIMAANVSDIAAMGGAPAYALVTLGLPPEAEVADVESLYAGMLDLGGDYGVAIVGGDVVRSPVIFVTVGLTGTCQGTLMLRSRAKPGDLVAVTGYVGSSAGGLAVMLEGLEVPSEAAQYLVEAHRRPRPCVSQGQILARRGVEAAMDISDGLLDDLSKLCRASGAAGRLEADQVPVHPLLRESLPRGYMDKVLGGGEDYQLLFTAPPELMAGVIPMLPAPAAVIGRVVEGVAGLVTVADSATGETLSAARGWDHFR